MELVAFTWVRCREGFRLDDPGDRLRKGSSRSKWIRGDAETVGLVSAGPNFDPYSPTKFPTLFRQFADVPTSPIGMRDFFTNFGPLSAGGEHLYSGGYIATSLDQPLRDHAAIRRALVFLDAGDVVSLTKFFNSSNGALEAAKWGRLRSELQLQPDGKVALVFVPSSLIQFMWLQLAMHAASDAMLLRCERCGSPIRVGTGTGHRNTKKFCSNACKIAAHRARHGREAHHE